MPVEELTDINDKLYTLDGNNEYPFSVRKGNVYN